MREWEKLWKPTQFPSFWYCSSQPSLLVLSWSIAVWHMTGRPFSSMAKGKSSSLAPFTTPEAPLKYISHFLVNLCLKFEACWFLCLWGGFVLKCVCAVLDVGGSDSEGQRWRLRCHWHLCLLECSWTFSWQCTILDLHLVQFQVLNTRSHTSHLTLYLFFVVSLCWVGLQYNFEGRYDLVRFLKTVQKVGLYAHLRIGPYVCAEWNFG